MPNADALFSQVLLSCMLLLLSCLSLGFLCQSGDLKLEGGDVPSIMQCSFPQAPVAAVLHNKPHAESHMSCARELKYRLTHLSRRRIPPCSSFGEGNHQFQRDYCMGKTL